MQSEEPADVVIVEDTEHDRQLALYVLRSLSPRTRVKALHDGPAVLDYLLPGDAATVPVQAPRLILLDLKMPGMDGIEVLRQLKGNVRTRLIPVVIFSSSEDAGDVMDAYDSGSNGYVVKPVDYDEYAGCLRVITEYWLTYNVGVTRLGDVT